MPDKRRRRRFQPIQPVIPEPTPTILERMGGLRGAGAAGVRGLAGLLSAPGGVLGAGVAGLGETAAELVEDPTKAPSLARVSTEALLGAVPFGKIFKAGRIAESALRGGLYSGVGTAARELAAGEAVDPGAAAVSTGLGALTGGGLAKLLAPAAKVPAGVRDYIVETTAQPGGRIAGQIGRTGKVKGMVPVQVPKPIRSTGPLPPVASKTAEDIAEAGRVPYIGTPAEAAGRVQRVIAREVAAEAKASKEAAKLAEQEAARARIEQEITRQGLEPKPPTVSESISAPIEGGRQRMAIRYAAPEAEESATGELLADVPPTVRQEVQREVLRPEPLVPAQPKEAFAITKALGVEPPLASAKGPGVEIPSAIAKFFRTRGGASGYGYRLAKAAVAAGEAPEDAARIARAGRLAEVEAERAAKGAPASPQIEAAPHAQPIPETSPTAQVDVVPTDTPEWVKDQLNLIDRWKQLPRSERGEINTQLLARLGLGAAGAVAGGAADPFGNPVLSAAAGGLAGFAAPSLAKMATARRAMADPNLGEAEKYTASQLSTAEGIQEKAKEIWNFLPNMIRGNLLISPNLPSNALAGPYGSGFFGALEYHLAGDPRGTEALKLMTPANWAKEYMASWQEAERLVGEAERAGGQALGETRTQLERIYAFPGHSMTAGDLATRNILMRAGFTEEEARRLTLTAEPEQALFRRVADIPRGSVAGKMLMPFSRTLANIAEQGLQRMPGVGFAVQAARGAAADPLRQQLTQQALGAAIGAGGAAAGYVSPEDPAQQRLLRSIVSNVGGPYALLSTLGYTAGQAAKQGFPAREIGKKTLLAGLRELPLPTTQIPEEAAQYAFAEPGTRKVPRFMYPGLIGAIREELTPKGRRPRQLRKPQRRRQR